MRFPFKVLPLAIVLAVAVVRVERVFAQAPSPDSMSAAPAPAAEVPPPRAGGGVTRGLAIGDTVRVLSPGGRVSGTIARILPDTLVLRSGGRDEAIARGEVARLERFAGRSPRGRAILIGAGAGLLGGGTIGAAAGRLVGRVRCTQVEGPCTPGHDSTIQGALLADGAILGSLIGAMLGPTFRRTRWETADRAFIVAAGPVAGGGVAAGVTLRF
jgi:hypothetical protein